MHKLLEVVCPEIGHDRPGQIKLTNVTPIRDSFSDIVNNYFGRFPFHQLTNVSLNLATCHEIIIIAIFVNMVHVLASYN